MCCTALHCPPLAASIYAQLEAGSLDLQLVLWTRPKWALGWWFLVGNPIGTPEKEPPKRTPKKPHITIGLQFLLTSSTAEGGGGSFRNRKPI